MRVASAPLGSKLSRVFKKKREDDSASDEVTTDQEASDSAADSPDVAGEAGEAEPEAAAEPTADRSEGPWDIDEVPADGMERVDFGAMQVPGVEGMQINLEVEEQSQTVVAVTVIIGEGAVQLQPFAAPRSGGFWPEVRAELMEGLRSQGGQVEEAEGSFGLELRAQVPAVNEAGEQGLQPARFLGIEGPRWLLKAVMLGAPAVDARAGEFFEEIVRGCVISRGVQPMAPGDLLPLRVPADASPDGQAELEADDEGEAPVVLDPFERGPEITETR